MICPADGWFAKYKHDDEEWAERVVVWSEDSIGDVQGLVWEEGPHLVNAGNEWFVGYEYQVQPVLLPAMGMVAP